MIMKYVYSIKEIAEQKKLDVAERDSLWAALAEEAGGGEKGKAVADAFRKLYTMQHSCNMCNLNLSFRNSSCMSPLHTAH